MTRGEIGLSGKKLAMERPSLWRPESHLSATVRDMPPSGIRKFFDIVVGMEGVISLGVGEPDFPTPWHIREACIYSLEGGHTSYTSNKGLPELREILAEAKKEDLKLEYDPEEEILITTGVSEAVDLAFRATLNPGDEVIVPQPCYVAYVPDIRLAGGVPRPVATRLSEEFKLRPEDFEGAISEKTKALVLSYPNNPTGAIMTREDLEEIADLVVENDLLVISDEVYEKLTYDGKHASFAQLEGMRERTVLLNGMSKSCAMTGWRIGYALGDPAIIGAMTKVHQYTMLCAPTMAQVAAVEALRRGDAEVKAMKREYDRRRRLFVSELKRLGLPCFEPKGAFYAFPSIEGTGLSSEEFAEELLKEQKVAAVPGNAFGDSGEGFIRCSYATSREEILEAVDRIERFLADLGT
ncbi:MAG: aminotransferase class I/II-fold pyridoxal phosphate-dependent enzyme [Methanothrix sp.]|uniref:Aminotransferase n=1 Tax=Methanothrix harundinacea TaxID=301375 RepID=A0A101FSM7_9EURY|nr:MAG: Aminotransferase [Methanothrix harundinacea]MDD3710340.1 aminotransferase class I/II-fold pyridoxal phosphate-dependent enzyme [Methanothrix sp.]MDI9398763.1 aminotransferase class I/II-fold pyridoxal phosphate-dependent enzyme [Euryarchaeota archaeon]KUK94675.1 MAG: Aminotransferase [Methanothrix harundinacea]MCP1391182.1 aminotransferase class I/II-fold pyridoxal phosphate-dependent enzyme [Methanothrix harundinacea]